MMPVCCIFVTSESNKCQRCIADTEEPESQVRNSNSFVFTICVTITICQTNFLDNNMVYLPNILSSPHCHTCSSIPRAPSTALYQSMFIHSLMARCGYRKLIHHLDTMGYPPFSLQGRPFNTEAECPSAAACKVSPLH